MSDSSGLERIKGVGPATAAPSTALHRGTALLTFRPRGSRRPVLAASADLGVVDLWSAGVAVVGRRERS